MMTDKKLRLFRQRNAEKMKALWYDSDVEEEADIYSIAGVQKLLEDDETTPSEAAFMEGYDEE